MKIGGLYFFVLLCYFLGDFNCFLNGWFYFIVVNEDDLKSGMDFNFMKVVVVER